MATSLGTNAVVVTSVHCIAVSCGLFVLSALGPFFRSVLDRLLVLWSFHVIKPLSGALGGLCCVSMTVPGYLQVKFRHYQYLARHLHIDTFL